ncbi:MAG: peptidylprolyl isomerase, partial [Deltaproteobacteria bacterium]|nr:peptidylprolyl isomerase [Deltaproteobacteria bacterium]
MVRSWCVIAATLALSACPPRSPPSKLPEAMDDRAVRIRIAQAEAKRGAGLTELVELATHGEPAERLLALRGLGRVGGIKALETLRVALRGSDPTIAAAAASAIGVLASLDEPESSPELTKELIAALGRVDAVHKPVVIEAIGRAADATAQETLVPLLDDKALAEASALALGRYGRRKIGLIGSAKLRLPAIAQNNPAITYAAIYALAREHVVPTDRTATDMAAHVRLAPVLMSLVKEGTPEVRAQAILAVVKHDYVESARAVLERALLDTDWRVAVEAVRALAGDKGTDAGRDAVAAALVRRFIELERGNLGEAHVVLEALRLLGAHAKRPLVMVAINALATAAAVSSKVEGLTYGWIGCLATAALVRSAETADLTFVDSCKLPDHLRLPLVGELVTTGVGPLAARRTAVARLLGHQDPRVRAAGFPALAALWKEGSDPDRQASIATIAGAIGSRDAIVAGSAIDAATAFYESIGQGDRSALDAAVIARARRETDAELAASLLALIGKQKIAAGADACRAGLDGHAVRIGAARTCLRALGEAVPPAEVAAASPPPVDVTAVIGADLIWKLVTTRGVITIALRSDIAPWAVATIVELTRKGYYNGLEVHRVVPDFVV